MMRNVSCALLCLLLGTAIVFAHHSVAAEFDVNKPIEFTGTVKAHRVGEPARLDAGGSEEPRWIAFRFTGWKLARPSAFTGRDGERTPRSPGW